MSVIAQKRSTRDLLCLLNHATDGLAAEVSAALADVGISQRTFCVLSQAISGDKTQTELADLCLLDKTTMVATLDRLENEGLARRESCSNDRRARIVKLTTKGRVLAETGQRIADAIYDDVLGSLPTQTRTGLVDGLRELAEDRQLQGISKPSRRARKDRA